MAFFLQMADYQDWPELHRLADTAAEAAGDGRGRAALRLALGWVMFEHTPPAELEGVFGRARAAFERLDDQGGVIEALIGQGSCLHMAEQLEQATACLGRAEALAVGLAAPDKQAAALFAMAMVERDQGDLERARERLERILPVWRRHGARRWEALTVRAAGLVLGALGDLPEAGARLQLALELAGELGDRRYEVQILVDQGELHLRLGEVGPAREALGLALSRAREMNLLYDQAKALHALGDLHAAEGDLGAAERCLAESARLWRLAGIPRRLARTLDRLGSVRAVAGR
jgi:tetratricopeptide (TPR) repeat protein